MNNTPKPGAFRRAAVFTAVAIGAAVGVIGATTASAADPYPDGATVNYAATQITPPPPASNFAGDGGGDGFDLAFYGGKVWNVFHHKAQIVLQCHDISTAATCAGYPATVTDTGTSHDFLVPDNVTIEVDSETGTLYVYSIDAVTLTAGVVAIDLDSAAANPFQSFTPLSAVGEAGKTSTNRAGLSNTVRIDSKLYAFNFKAPTAGYTPVGTEDQLMCFDTSNDSACTSQPYAIPGLPSTLQRSGQPPIIDRNGSGSHIMLQLGEGSYWSYAGHYFCFDTGTLGTCGGSWPVAADAAGIIMGGTGFPVLDDNGTQTGTCWYRNDSTWSNVVIADDVFCYDDTGAFLTAESAATSLALTANLRDSGNNFLTLGTRVYLPASNPMVAPGNSAVECFDWATDTNCTGYPISFDLDKTSYVYSIRNEATNPTCLWVNSDTGSQQIKNFDAYTGGPCGDGGTRIQMGNFVQPTTACVPTHYTTLTVTSPLPAAYSGGTITFQDADGSPLNSIPVQNIDASGVVDLSSLDLSTAYGLPQMLVNLPGAQAEAISMTIKWTGPYHEACTADGQSVSDAQVLPPTGASATSMARLAVAMLAAGVVLLATRRRSPA